MLSYSEAAKILEQGSIKKIASNTFLHQLKKGKIGIQFQGVDVVIIHPDNTYTLQVEDGDVVARNKINDFSPATLIKKRGELLIVTDKKSVSFYNGIRVNRHGEVMKKIE